jgi:hypothetical protein
MNPREAVPQIVQHNYDLSLWLIQKVERFPRAHRYSVGDRIVARSLDLHEALLDAVRPRQPAAPPPPHGGRLAQIQSGKNGSATDGHR